MPIRKTVAQGIQEFSEYQKQHEFFVVVPTAGSVQKPKPYRERMAGWVSMCQNANLKLQDSYVEGSGNVILMFQNGLKITDKGHRVSFSATEEKSKVNMKSAMTVIRCSANHLCRQGWDLGVDFSTVRFGTSRMLTEFEEAYKGARQIVNTERIKQLKKGKSY